MKCSSRSVRYISYFFFRKQLRGNFREVVKRMWKVIGQIVIFKLSILF